MKSYQIIENEIKHLLSHPSENCVLWLGKTDKDGYARVWNGEFTPSGYSKKVYLHRIALKYKLGRDLIKGYLTTHSCRNRNCYNPWHLEEKLPQGNTDDRLRDKTYTRHLGLRKTNTSGYKGVSLLLYAKRGHPTGSNLFY